ncbi:MAG: radical SAM protein [Dehalococcoidales bacterium]|nr:radical SAM protein [Dehalococcoidales bacterium]
MADIPDSRNEVDFTRLHSFSYEIGPIRPPSEGGSFSLLLRVTGNCPWSRCTFCYGRFYGREKFRLRTVDEVKADIDAVRGIADELTSISRQLGYDGDLKSIARVIQNELAEHQQSTVLTEQDYDNLQSVVNTYNWLVAGGRTVFLQDADSLIMKAPQLVEIITYLKSLFPQITRITTYARSKSVSHKTEDELKALNRAGLTRLHIGLETGDDELLKIIDKGVTAAEHISAGRKALDAGFELSEYVMPGLGGRKLSQQHAVNTAKVLNDINPSFIRMRPLVPSAGTPMLDACRNGEFEMLSPHELLREERLFIETLEVTSGVCFDHNNNVTYRSGNYRVPLLKQDYDGYQFPEEKQEVLEIIDKALSIDEKLFYDLRDLVGTSSM